MRKGALEQCKRGQTSKEEYRGTASLCRDAIRKAKAQLELKGARDNKNNLRVSASMLASKSTRRI